MKGGAGVTIFLKYLPPNDKRTNFKNIRGNSDELRTKIGKENFRKFQISEAGVTYLHNATECMLYQLIVVSGC